MTNINRSDAKVGDVLIVVSYPDGGGDTRATLRVEDQMSGTTLVQVDLAPEQYMRILASGVVPVSGARLPARPELIGRRMENTATNIHHGNVGRDIDAEAERLRDKYLLDGWERVSIDRTSFGRRVRAYRWVAAEQD